MYLFSRYRIKKSLTGSVYLLNRLILVFIFTGIIAAAQASSESEEPGKQAGIDIKNGENIYFSTCQPCHGDNGEGGFGGGAPLTDALTINDVMIIAKQGRNAMPEFGSVYTEQELKEVATFIVEELLSN